MNSEVARQVTRQIELFLEDGERARLTVALATLDMLKEPPAAVEDSQGGALGEWSVHVQPGCEAHVRLALTDVTANGVNEIEAFLEPGCARDLARELVDHAEWCERWIEEQGGVG